MHNKEIAALTFKNRNNDIATPVGDKLRSNWPARVACQGGRKGEYKDDLQCNYYGRVAVLVIIQVI